MALRKINFIALCAIISFIFVARNQSYGWLDTYGGTAFEGLQCEFPFSNETLEQALTQASYPYKDTWRDNMIHDASELNEWCVGTWPCSICVVQYDGLVPLWGFCEQWNIDASRKNWCISGIRPNINNIWM